MSDPPSSSTPERASTRQSLAGTLTVARPAYDAVVAHAREGALAEVCGVLGGERGADGGCEGGGEASDARVAADGVRRVANVADDARTTYELEPTEQLAAMDAVEAAGMDVVGFYHSHPAGPPRPSRTDVARATWPGYSYVIVALDGEPFVGSWRWTGEAFVPQRVAIG